MFLILGTPRGLDFNEVKGQLLEIEGVTGVHDLHIWSIAMNKLAFSVHLSIGMKTYISLYHIL